MGAARPFSTFLQHQPNVICDAVHWLLKWKGPDGAYLDWRGVPTLHFIKVSQRVREEVGQGEGETVRVTESQGGSESGRR